METAAYISLLRRRWVAIVLCLLAGLIAAVTVVRSTEETYRSSTQLIINIPAALEVQEALQGFQLSSQLLASYARVATSRSAATEVVEKLGLDTSAAALQSRLSAEPVPETLLMTISAEAGDPNEAKRLADAAASVFVDTVADLERGKAGAIEPRVIDRAQPPSRPVSPKPTRDITAGTILGLMVGAALALLLESLDKSIRVPSEVATLSGAPLLAVVPKRRDAAARPLLGPDDAGSPAAEAYRVLRTALRFMEIDGPARTLVVASPSASEGKTSTAANLATALAQGGERVILVDADLRRSRMADIFGYANDLGLSSVIIGDCSLDEALVRITDRLSVLPTGPLPPNPSELLGSQAMVQLVAELQHRSDVVLFDTAPLLPVADAQVLSTQADGVLMVCRFGRTEREQLAEARRRLEVVGGRLVGSIFNGVPSSASYSEEYSYYALAAGAKPAGLRQRLTRR